MKTRINFMLILLISTLLLLGLAQNAMAKVFKWKICMGFTSMKGNWPVNRFAKALQKEFRGKIDFQIFEPGEHPYSPSDVVKPVRDNIMQIGFSNAIYTQGLSPRMGMSELPFMFGSAEEFLAMMDDPAFSDLFDYILAGQLKEWNQFPIAWFTYGGYMFAGPRWVDDFDSWKGLRIRVHGRLSADMMKAFATPVNVVWDEVYTGLQRKMIDGFITATGGAYPAKLFENTKWVTINDYSMGFFWLTCNQDAFNELPKELQDRFMKVCNEQRKLLQAAYFTKDEHTIKMSMKYYGVRFKYMDPSFREKVRERMRPIWEEWAKRAGGKAFDFLKRVEEFHKEYSKSHK